MTTPPDLRSFEIFQDVSDEDLGRVLAEGTFVSVPAGWSLIWEETPADKAYLLLSGEASIRRDGSEFARVGAGQLIGETAIVTHNLRNATVVASTDIEALHLTREAVEELAAQSPAFKAALQRSAASHGGSSETQGR